MNDLFFPFSFTEIRSSECCSLDIIALEDESVNTLRLKSDYMIVNLAIVWTLNTNDLALSDEMKPFDSAQYITLPTYNATRYLYE